MGLALVKNQHEQRPDRDTETVRPYRFWDSKRKRNIPYKYYSDLENAWYGAMKYCHAANEGVGFTVELWNVSTGRFIESFTLTTKSIEFSKPVIKKMVVDDGDSK